MTRINKFITMMSIRSLVSKYIWKLASICRPLGAHDRIQPTDVCHVSYLQTSFSNICMLSFFCRATFIENFINFAKFYF